MGGRSGTRVAGHTLLAIKGSSAFAISEAQARIIGRARRDGGGTYLRGAEVRSARKLESLGLAELRDDGDARDGDGTVDGERWWFSVAEPLTLNRPAARAAGVVDPPVPPAPC